MEIKKAETKKDYAFCIYVRTLVFIIGQKCPLHEEIDNTEEGVIDYIGMIGEDPVTTARYRIVDGNTGKIERVAVIDGYQGQGCGKKTMQYLIDEIKKNTNIRKIKLGAQSHAIPFYEALGFSAYSDEYMDAGIPHRDMAMEVK